MGKAKKRHGVKSHFQGDYIDNSKQKGVPSDITELEANLSSIDETKRINASSLLADIFLTRNEKSSEKLSTVRFLSKFSMRLLDNSIQVRLNIANAIKNLSFELDATVSKRIVNCGLLKTILSLCMDVSAWEVSNGDFVENLMLALENFFSQSFDAIREVESHSPEFVSFLIQSFCSGPSSAVQLSQLRSAVASVLGILVERSSAIIALLGDQEIQLLWSFIQSLDSSNSNTDNSRKNITLTMKLYEVLVAVLMSRNSFDGDKLLYIVSSAQTLVHQSLAIMGSRPSSETIPVTVENSATEIEQDGNSMVTTDAEGYTDNTGDNANPKGEEEALPFDLLKMALDLTLSIATARKSPQSDSDFMDMAEHCDSSAPQKAGLSMVVDADDAARMGFVGELFESSRIFQACNECLLSVFSRLQSSINIANAPVVEGASSEGSTKAATARPFLVPYEVYGYLMALEQVVGVLDALLSLKIANPSKSDFSAVGLPELIKFLQYLFDLVTKTTKSKDATSDVFSEWLIADGLDKKSFRETLVSLCVATMEFVGSIIKVSYCNPGSSGSSMGQGGSSDLLVIIPTEDALKQLALLLVQCISFPIFELAAAGISTVGIWGQRDFRTSGAESTSPSPSSSLLLYSKAVNFFLTNALLRRLMEPNGFAVTSRYLLYIEGNDDDNQSSLKSSSRKSKGKGVDVSRMKELNQKRNVELSGLRISDACFNSLIDLHASDDPAYLENFVRLNSLDKLSSRFQDFGNRLNNSIMPLIEEDAETFETTMQNVDNFLTYKRDFINACK